MAVVGQMALSALVIGTAAAALGTGRVTISLVLSTALIWGWIPVVQLLTGLFLVRGPVPIGRALSEYFATGHYWSLWILTFAGVMLLMPQPFAILDCMVATMIVPAGLTARALARFRRERFADTKAAARRRVLVHQAVTHGILLLYISWAVALWPRLIAMGRA